MEGVGHDVLLTDLPIDVESSFCAVRHADAGNVSVFVDLVMPQTPGATLTHVEYEAIRPVALADMQRCVDEIASVHPGARLAVSHRLGRLAVGEIALVCAVSAPNRSDAIAACGALVLAIKTRVPIGRREIGDVPAFPRHPAPTFSSDPPAAMTASFSPIMTPAPYALDVALIRKAAIRIASGGPLPATPSITVDIEEHELEPLEGHKSPYPNTLPPAPLNAEAEPKRLTKRKRS